MGDNISKSTSSRSSFESSSSLGSVNTSYSDSTSHTISTSDTSKITKGSFIGRGKHPEDQSTGSAKSLSGRTVLQNNDYANNFQNGLALLDDFDKNKSQETLAQAFELLQHGLDPVHPENTTELATAFLKISQNAENFSLSADAILIASNLRPANRTHNKQLVKLALTFLNSDKASEIQAGMVLIDQAMANGHAFSSNKKSTLAKLLGQATAKLPIEEQEAAQRITADILTAKVKQSPNRHPGETTLLERLPYTMAAQTHYQARAFRSISLINEGVYGIHEDTLAVPTEYQFSWWELNSEHPVTLRIFGDLENQYGSDRVTLKEDGSIKKSKGIIFKVMVNDKKNPPEVTLSFGGTSAGTKRPINPTSTTWKRQWHVNIKQTAGKVTGSDLQVIEIAKIFQNAVSNYEPLANSPIVCTGHSKGGKEAIIAAFILLCKAYVDNPAIIESGLDKLLRSDLPVSFQNFIKENIFVLSTSGDPVSLIHKSEYFHPDNHIIVKTRGDNPMHYHSATHLSVIRGIQAARAEQEDSE